MSLAQLEYELEALSPARIASVLVMAIEYISSFFAYEGGERALIIAKAIEMPNSLNEEDAYAIYWELENALITGRMMSKESHSKIKAHFDALDIKADNFRNEAQHMEIALLLLLSRIAVSINRENKYKLLAIARRLNVGIPLIDEAIKKLRLGHSLIGSLKPDEYYAEVSVRARNYAFSYMVLCGASLHEH